MREGWRRDGPLSLPPRGVMAIAASALAVSALIGVAMGWSAAYRPALGGIGDASAPTAGLSGVMTAQPLVDLTPPQAEKAATDAGASSDADAAKAEDLAAQTAKAQALQAQPGGQGDIDQILASPNEKPPAPTKPGAQEAPPPPKTDVPF